MRRASREAGLRKGRWGALLHRPFPCLGLQTGDLGMALGGSFYDPPPGGCRPPTPTLTDAPLPLKSEKAQVAGAELRMCCALAQTTTKDVCDGRRKTNERILRGCSRGHAAPSSALARGPSARCRGEVLRPSPLCPLSIVHRRSEACGFCRAGGGREASRPTACPSARCRVWGGRPSRLARRARRGGSARRAVPSTRRRGVGRSPSPPEGVQGAPLAGILRSKI